MERDRVRVAPVPWSLFPVLDKIAKAGWIAFCVIVPQIILGVYLADREEKKIAYCKAVYVQSVPTPGEEQ